MKNTLKIPAELRRSATMEKKDDGSFAMSISSDKKYLRTDWDGEQYYEMLSHDDGGIMDDRLKGGLPILFNHDRDAHLGRAASFAVKDDGNGGKRCVVSNINWSESDFAQEKKKDAMNGSLPDTSVGYRVLDDGECIGAENGIPVYKFKWEPHEGSLVTVPADPSVGVGREGECLEVRIFQKTVDGKTIPSQATTSSLKSMEVKDQPAKEEAKIDIVAERAAAAKDLQSKQKKIWDFVKAIKNDTWRKAAEPIAMEAMMEPDCDFEDTRHKINNAVDGIRDVGQVNGDLGLSKKELKNFSFCEMIRTMGRTQDGIKIPGQYLEASAEVTKLMRGREPEGLWIPQDVLSKGLQEIHGLGRNSMARHSGEIQQLARALTATNFSAGGALVGEQLLAGSYIELLLNKIAFLEGTTYLGGLVGNIAIPRNTGPVANSFWLPEGGTVSSNDMSFSQLVLTPKRLSSLMVYDKQLVAQASLSVEALVRDYFARIMAVEKNRAMINGSGTNGQPLGLFNTPGVQTVTFNIAGAPTWKEIVNFDTLVEQANADTLGMRSWLTAPGAKGNLKTTGRALTGANVVVAVPIWMDDNTMNGYSADTTQNVPGNQVLFGSGSEFVVGDWAGIDMVVDPYTYSDRAQIRVTINMWTDQGVRHEVAFVISTNNAA